VGDDVLEFIDGHPFRDALKNAVEIRWSGILRAVKDSEQVGVVVMRDGHIAWAVSNSQTENFGSFLERIGMVPKEKLNEVVRKYRSLGKSKKLGALLEEAGLISHSTLRECLRAHVSAALSSMMDDPGILLDARHGEMAIDASLVFLLGEVVPEAGEQFTPVTADVVPSASDAPREETLSEVETAALQELSSLPGYMYSFVADVSGRIHSIHQSDDVQLETNRVVTAVCAWLEASCSCSPEMKLGSVRFTLLTCENGSIFVQMVDGDTRDFVAVACDKNARMGVVMHKISEVVSTIRVNTERL
jgi:predicted regulator of Ras-like GTPase activity (Roadblock/LC7/MglB family)